MVPQPKIVREKEKQRLRTLGCQYSVFQALLLSLIISPLKISLEKVVMDQSTR